MYFLISYIIETSSYVGNIFLLVTLYSLIFYFFSPFSDRKRPLKRKLLLAHYGFCAILIALFLSILGLGIYNLVQLVRQYRYYSYIYNSERVNLAKLNVTFDALTFVASVEIFVASVWIVFRSLGEGQSKKVRLICTCQKNLRRTDCCRPAWLSIFRIDGDTISHSSDIRLGI